MTQPIEIVATLDGSVRAPSFSVSRVGSDMGIRFAGIPMGHEFTSLVLALLQAGGHPPKADAALIEQIRALDADLDFEVYISLSCQNCPDVVQALNLMAVLNRRVRATMIDGALFQAEVEARGILAVPTVHLNGQPFGQGRMSVEEILARLDTNAGARAAAKINERAPFDVLIVGGGPAGASAAIYAARKGIRTGVVTETEGPQPAARLENHVRTYDVDIMNLQRAEGLKREDATGLLTVKLASGAALRSRSVILPTGARWREMNVPGEREYRGRGVAYCPRCDGPLFKGKRVAVIGGGNSGVEAAIDLAGIVGHVTLIEFDGQLRADGKVNGLSYQERSSGERHRLDLEGVFAAGDATTVPHKQIIIAMGEGSKAALGACDHLLRASAPAARAAAACDRGVGFTNGCGRTAAVSP